MSGVGSRRESVPHVNLRRENVLTSHIVESTNPLHRVSCILRTHRNWQSCFEVSWYIHIPLLIINRANITYCDKIIPDCA